MNRYKLKDLSLSKLEYGSGAAASEYDGVTRYVRITDIDDDGNLGHDIVSPNLVEDKYLLNEGDVVFARTGATVGKTFRYRESDGRCIYAGFLIRVVPNQELIRPDYLYFFTKSPQYRQFVQSSMKVVAQPNINAKQYGDLEFNVPDLNTQDEIVSNLLALSHIVELRKRELSALDNLIKARFVEMFGTPYVNEKGFPMLTVDDVIEFTGGAQPDKKYFEYEPTEDNIRLIQIRDYKTDNYITYIPKSMAKRFCKADDIMIGRYGPPIFQILKGIEGSYNVALMKATPKIGNKEFIRYFLKQECLFNYLDGLSQRTAGQSGIEMPALKAYPFPYPPIELQEQFEQFANQVDKSKVAVQKALDETQLLFDSLMQKYFG